MIAQSLPEELASGLRLHQAGRLDEAARLYEVALSRYPTNADACCLLGVVRNQQGQPAMAVELIERAVALRPALRVSMRISAWPGRRRAAWPRLPRHSARRCRCARRMSAVHVNRGVIVRALGEKALALEHFRRATELNPRLAQARTNLGALLTELGRPEDALPHCQIAVATSSPCWSRPASTWGMSSACSTVFEGPGRLHRGDADRPQREPRRPRDSA